MAVNLANPVVRSHPINKNKLAWWKYLPGNGISGVPDILFNNNASLVNSPPRWGFNGVNTWGAIKVGDGGNAYAVRNSSRSINTTQPFTIGGSAFTTASTTQWIVSIKVESLGSCVAIGQRGGSAWKVEGYGASSSPNLTGTTTPSARWDRVVYTWDGTNGYIYVNGKQEGTNATAPQSLASGSYDVYLGRIDASYDQWTGAIDDVFYADVAWNSSIVAMDYLEWRTAYPTAIRRITRSPTIFLPAAGSFKSAWARGSNVILQPGVLT